MSKFFDGLEKYIYWTSIPKIGLNDIVDILIVSVMIYLIVKWIKTTRAWVLLKGIIILLCIAFAAYLLQLHTVSWILSNTMGVGITAILIVFQPELRSALEQLGRKNWVTDIFSTDSRQEELEYTARTLQEISRAAIEMGKVKTGALIVLQREVALGEYERTGIPIDAKVSSQLLINIFEHNTQLHDGAVAVDLQHLAAADGAVVELDFAQLVIGDALNVIHHHQRAGDLLDRLIFPDHSASSPFSAMALISSSISTIILA